MSRYTHFQFRGEREGRVAQMTKQEEVIARKKLELLEKQKTTELAKQVAAAQSSSAKVDQTEDDSTETTNKLIDTLNTEQQTTSLLKNNFSNDGSFLVNFKKITEAAAKKAEEERLKEEQDAAEKEKNSDTNGENKEHQNSDSNQTRNPNQERNQNSQRKKHNLHNISNNAGNIPSLLSLPIHPPTTDFSQTNQNICAPLISELGSVPPPPPPPVHTYPVQNPIMPAPMAPIMTQPPPMFGSSGPGSSLQQIPPPKPLSLNAIPSPRELDLTAIPEPRMNVGTIKVPEISNQLHAMHHNQNVNNPGVFSGINFNIDNQNVTEHGQNNELIRNLNQINNLKTNVQTNFAAIEQTFSMITSSSAENCSKNNGPTYPTSIDGLIELVILNGDNYEDKFRLQFSDIEHTPFW